MKTQNILASHPNVPLLGHPGKVTCCLPPASSFQFAKHFKSIHFRCKGRDRLILQAGFLTKLEQNNHALIPKPSGWFYSD